MRPWWWDYRCPDSFDEGGQYHVDHKGHFFYCDGAGNEATPKECHDAMLRRAKRIAPSEVETPQGSLREQRCDVPAVF